MEKDQKQQRFTWSGQNNTRTPFYQTGPNTQNGSERRSETSHSAALPSIKKISIQHMQMSDAEQGAENEEVVPGVQIVRSNTPRPMTFDMLMSASGYTHVPGSSEVSTSFPSQAPSAPPLPEEDIDEALVEQNSTFPLNDSTAQTKTYEEQQGFIWLFEYGLEMDPAILNSSERLDDTAILYGPAVLRHYTLMLGAQNIHGERGPTVVAIAPCSDPGAEVWGMLYRIPAHVCTMQRDDPSLLDTIHAAIPPQYFFQAREVQVQEVYRERSIQCLTYVATPIACQQLQLVAAEYWRGDPLFLQRLLTIARKQKLPEAYIDRYEAYNRKNQEIRLEETKKALKEQKGKTFLPSIPASVLPSPSLPMKNHNFEQSSANFLGQSQQNSMEMSDVSGAGTAPINYMSQTGIPGSVSASSFPINHVSHLGQINQVSQMEKINHISQMGQVNHVSQMGQITHISQMGQVGYISQMGQMNPVATAGSLSPLNTLNTLRPVSAMGQLDQRIHQETATDHLSAFKTMGTPRFFSSAKVKAIVHTTPWLIVFACYIVLILVLTLTLAILQGLGVGQGILNDHFMPLGVPWLVILYGLLGGCVSTIVSLSYLRLANPPSFVVITWFTRPFIGAIFAIFAYILLTSGLLALSHHTQNHTSLLWLVGAIAGFCESLLFIRKK